jgi:excisionase family DNA binding protein
MSPQSEPPPRPEPLLTEIEACEFLRIRPRQLYAWRKQGLIPYVRISRSVRYRRSELEAALDTMSVRVPTQGHLDTSADR